MITYRVAREWGTSPAHWPGHPKNGINFLNQQLYYLYWDAINTNQQLCIDLDGGHGYSETWLRDAFTGLGSMFPDEDAIQRLTIISKDQPSLIEKIYGYISAGQIDSRLRINQNIEVKNSKIKREKNQRMINFFTMIFHVLMILSGGFLLFPSILVPLFSIDGYLTISKSIGLLIHGYFIFLYITNKE